MQRWSTVHASRTAGLPEAALRLFVFDLYTENGDRQTGSNPNAPLVGGRLVAIDHGQALPAVLGIDCGSPFDHEHHVAWPIVDASRGRLTELVDCLPSPAAIAAALAEVPDSWWPEPGRREFARHQLEIRVGQVQAILAGLSEP